MSYKNYFNCNIILLLLIVNLLIECNCHPILNVTYDQRQSGKINIQLNIKDLAIISFNDEKLPSSSSVVSDDTAYDYDYDYDQLTVNPLVGLYGSPAIKPSPKPTTTESSIVNVSIIPANNNSSVTVKPSNIHDIILSNQQQITLSEKPISTSSIKPLTTNNTNFVLINNSNNNLNPEQLTIKNDGNNQMTSTDKNQLNYENMQQIPVHIIMEPILKPKIRSQINNFNRMYSKKPSIEIINNENQHRSLDINENINKRKLNTDCTEEGRFIDRLGRCRTRRSGIRRLLNILLSQQ